MTNPILWTILSLSVSGSILGGILFLMKPLLKDRLSKAFSYYIWLIVLLRMVLPVSASVNIIDGIVQEVWEKPAETIVSEEVFYEGDGEMIPDIGQEYLMPEITGGQVQKPAVKEPITFVKVPSQGEELFRKAWNYVKENLHLILLAGTVISFLWYVLGYIRFAVKIDRESYAPDEADMAVFRRIAGKTRVKMLCNPMISTPLLMGVFFPKILIPAGEYAKSGNGERLENLLKHELTHYRRKDLLYKWASVMVSAVHWFNPMMILIRKEISNACELSCDEAVIRNMTQEEKISYGETLLSFVVRRNLPKGVVATTFGERKTNLKKRIKSIATYHKKPIWVLGISLILALLLTGCAVVTGVATGTDPEPVEEKFTEIKETVETEEEQKTAEAEKPAETPEEAQEPVNQTDEEGSLRRYFYIDRETDESIFVELNMTYTKVKEVLNELVLKKPADGTLYTVIEGEADEDAEETKASITVTETVNGTSLHTALFFDEEQDGELLLTRVMWRRANINTSEMQKYLFNSINTEGIPQYKEYSENDCFFIWPGENGYYAQHHMNGDAVSWRLITENAGKKLLEDTDNSDIYFIEAENNFLTDVVGEEHLPKGWIRPEDVIDHLVAEDWDSAYGIGKNPQAHRLDGYAIYDGELYYAIRTGSVIKEGYPTHVYLSLDGEKLLRGTKEQVF